MDDVEHNQGKQRQIAVLRTQLRRQAAKNAVMESRLAQIEHVHGSVAKPQLALSARKGWPVASRTVDKKFEGDENLSIPLRISLTILVDESSRTPCPLNHLLYKED